MFQTSAQAYEKIYLIPLNLSECIIDTQSIGC